MSFWNSRNRLAFGSIVALVLISLLDEPSHYEEREEIDDLIEDVDYAVDAMDYMAGLKNGKSVIRGVVEKEHPVEEWYWSCPRRVAPIVKESPWAENDGFFIFSAYFDDRENSLFPNNPSVQVLLLPSFSIQEDHLKVLAMSWRTLENKSDVFCALHSEKGFAFVKGYVREIWQRAWDPRDHFYVPNLVTCPVPERMKKSLEMIVYLSKTPCKGQEESMMVSFPERKEEEEKKTVAICVKGMDFQEDVSSRLVEWLEAELLFGADKVTLYTYSVSAKTSKVLEYYEKQGKVAQVPLSLPGTSPNFPTVRSSYIWRNRQQKRRHELIPYNDCLYRHLHSHKYILILDTDEILVPLKHSTYEEMLNQLEKDKHKKISSVVARNVFKFPTNETDPSSFLFLLKNRKRSRKTSGVGEYGKSFSRVSNVATVFNHFALHRLSSSVSSSVYLPEETAVKLHYKEKCPIESHHECNQLISDTVVDHSLDRFEKELKRRVQKALLKV